MKTAASTAPDALFRALADRTRLRILCLLARGELCVCDLVGVLKLSQPKVSRHLAYLRRRGLVRARKEGIWSYYRLAPAEDELHQKLLECLAACPACLPEAGRDAVRLVRERRGECC